jgi:hypothetical protein
MDWANVTWLLTGLGFAVVVLTRARLGGLHERSSGFSSVPHAVLTIHTVVGMLAVGLWVAALITGRRPLMLAGLAAWWILTIAGLMLLTRWLPSGGRHAEGKATDAWGEGIGLSALAHIGTLVGVCYFTFVGLTGRL